MAISKQFIPHTELKAEDLNELISQTNDFVVQEGNKKPDIIDITNYLSEGTILPDSSYYVHAGRPVLSTSGDYYDTRWIGFCMSHFNNLNHSIALYTRNENDRYVFYSQFRADEADTPLEEHVALVFGGLPATPTTPGLMSAADKNKLDGLVTQVADLKSDFVGKMDAHPGKNLMNPEAFVEGKWIRPEGIDNVGYGIGMSNLIPISNGETLTVKVWGGGNLFQCRFALFDENRQIITSSVTEAYGSNDITGSITGTSESKYAAFTLRKQPNETDYKVQIESASSPTDYEPYTDYQPLADLKDELEDELNNVDGKVDELKQQIEGYYVPVTVAGSEFAENKFLNSNGFVSSANGYSTSPFIDLSAISDVSEIKFLGIMNNTYGGGILFFDSSKTVISGIYNTGESGNVEKTLTDEDIPEGTVYIRTCFQGAVDDDTDYITIGQGNLTNGKIGTLEDEVDALADELHEAIGEEVEKTQEIQTYTVVGVSYMDGSTDPNNRYKRLGRTKFPCAPNKLTELNVFGIWYSRSGYGGIQFFDEEENFISTIKALRTDIYSTSKELVPLSEIPVNAVYFDVCCYKADAEDEENYPLITIKYLGREADPAIAELQEQVEEIDARVEVLEEKIENGLDDAFIVLPNTLYVKKNQKANIYFKQFVQSSDYGNEYSVSQFIRNGVGGPDISATFMPAYERQFSGTPSAANTYPAVYYLRRYNKLIDTWTGNIIASDIPSTAKTINVLTVGDSITDIGNYQRRLIELLYDDDVTINYIGTMGYKEYEHGTVRMEALSGGNMSFMTEHNGNAKILTVSGITELPVTGYPGTSYQDANGNNWVVRGFKMEKQANNTYSGLLKLGVFRSDPNYGDGSQSGSESDNVFPSSGTITKVNSLAGDAIITYTAVTEARFNPFWNPATDQLDFEYYLNFWNFESPDVLIMQWGYNEVSSFIDIDHQSISTAVSRAKTIIDKFHAQLPNAKVIYGFDPYGAELPRSASSHRNDGKKYAMLNFEKKIIEEFSKPEYADFVIIVPISAMVDNVYGYGAIIEENINPVYPSVTVKRLANGHDGVHPPYGYALNEAALAYEAVLLALI